ncbi:MAG: site-specific integrase [Lachnospiraceae bacterium]|nr:site-specific integrase [Lachnospiraceae bacterium]
MTNITKKPACHSTERLSCKNPSEHISDKTGSLPSDRTVRLRILKSTDLSNICGEKCENDISFGKLADRFLEEKHSRVRASTYESYKGVIERVIRPCFGNMQADDIEPYQIRNWQNFLISLGYRPGYLRKMNSLLSSIFKYGARFYGLSSNPVALAGSVFPGKPHDEIHFWTPGEYGKFIKTVNHSGKRLIFNILYWTGMRVGELLALTREDIDLKKCSISITKTYRRKGSQDIISPPKTHKSNRTIFLNKSLALDIAEYLNSLGSIEPGERIFRINLQTLRRSFYSLAIRARLVRIKLHDLRHSHASYLINNNVQPLAVSDRLGHEQTETTLETYSHLFPKEKKRLTLSLEEEYKKLGCSLRWEKQAAESGKVDDAAGMWDERLEYPVGVCESSKECEAHAENSDPFIRAIKNAVSNLTEDAVIPENTPPYDMHEDEIDKKTEDFGSKPEDLRKESDEPGKEPDDYELLSKLFRIWPV